MDNNHTLIALLLDASTSMHRLQRETISSVNHFVDAQKGVPGRATFTLVQFNTAYFFTHNARPLVEVPPLTTETYVPNGDTALLDALGRTIDETGKKLAALPEAERPGKVIVVVMTDGEENSSIEYTREKVMGMVQHQQEAYGWQFLFLGAGPDAITQAGAMGIKPQAAMIYNATSLGVGKALASTNDVVRSVRTSGGLAEYTAGQRRENS
jgi:uncharacterized protein YegL